MPAWLLRVLAALLTGMAMVGSFSYVGAHPKNPLAPLQPPVVGRAPPPEVVEEEEQELPLPAPTPTPTLSPTPTPRASPTPTPTASPTRLVVTLTPTPAPVATPRPTLTLGPGVRVTTKKQPVTTTYVS